MATLDIHSTPDGKQYKLPGGNEPNRYGKMNKTERNEVYSSLKQAFAEDLGKLGRDTLASDVYESIAGSSKNYEYHIDANDPKLKGSPVSMTLYLAFRQGVETSGQARKQMFYALDYLQSQGLNIDKVWATDKIDVYQQDGRWKLRVVQEDGTNRIDGYLFPEVDDGAATEVVDDGTATEVVDDGTATEVVDDGTATEVVDDGTVTEVVDDGTATEVVDDGTATEVVDDGTATEVVDDGTATEVVDDGTATEVVDDGTATEVVDDGTATEVVDDGTATEVVDDGTATEVVDDGTATEPRGLEAYPSDYDFSVEEAKLEGILGEGGEIKEGYEEIMDPEDPLNLLGYKKTASVEEEVVEEVETFSVGDVITAEKAAELKVHDGLSFQNGNESQWEEIDNGDGTFSYKYKGETATEVVDDGTVTEVVDDGTVTEVVDDGTVTEVVDDGTATEVVDDGTATEVVDDGTATEVVDDGPATEVVDDGTATEVVDDGTATEVVDDGTATEVVDDGTATEVVDDGTATEVVDDGTATEVVDDGAATEVVDDGTATEVVDDGTATEVVDDGTATETLLAPTDWLIEGQLDVSTLLREAMSPEGIAIKKNNIEGDEYGFIYTEGTFELPFVVSKSEIGGNTLVGYTYNGEVVVGAAPTALEQARKVELGLQ